MRRSADARVLLHDLGHQLVGMQAAFHHRIDFACANQSDRFLRGGAGVRRVDQLHSANVEFQAGGEGVDAILGPDQNWLNYLGGRRLDGAAQRSLIARMDDHCPHRCKRVTGKDQRIVFFVPGRFVHVDESARLSSDGWFGEYWHSERLRSQCDRLANKKW